MTSTHQQPRYRIGSDLEDFHFRQNAVRFVQRVHIGNDLIESTARVRYHINCVDLKQYAQSDRVTQTKQRHTHFFALIAATVGGQFAERLREVGLVLIRRGHDRGILVFNKIMQNVLRERVHVAGHQLRLAHFTVIDVVLLQPRQPAFRATVNCYPNFR